MSSAVLNWWWWRPRGVIAPPMARLRLSDYVQQTANSTIDVLGLLVAGPRQSNGDIYLAGSVGSIIDPASDLTLDTQDTTISTVRITSGGTVLTLRRSGSAGWDAAFEGTGPYIESTLVIQTARGQFIVLPVTTTLDDAGSGFIRFDVPNTGQFRTMLDGLGDGDRFIVAIERPRPVSAADRLLWGSDQLLWGSDQLLWGS